MTIGYHCSPKSELTIRDGFCVADDSNVAAMYRRGGDVSHYLYSITWGDDVSVASEAEMIATWERITKRTHDEAELSTWDVAQNGKVRKALIEAGYEAICYGDSHDGCNYETTDFMTIPATLKIVEVKTLEAE